MTEPIVVGGGAGARNRRVIILATVAAGVLLAVVVLPGLLFGGDDGGSLEDDFGPVAGGTTTTTTQAGPEPDETFEPFSSKNPFEPLVDAGSPAVGDSDPAEESVTTSTIPIDDGSDFPVDEGGVPIFEDGSPPDDGPPTSSTTAPPPPRQPDRVSLLEVFTDQSGRVVASVRVNDITHQVGEGQDFADRYRVVDLDIGTRCGQFLFGDDRFHLCEGDETLK